MIKATILTVLAAARAEDAASDLLLDWGRPTGGGHLGKSTYAMSHPFGFKAFMENYFPTAEQLVQENSTKKCVEWAKICMDDGTASGKQICSSQTAAQLHSVGAYKRDSGSKSMEAIEADFTAAMGDLQTHDPYFESHVAFLTKDLDYYADAFANGSVPVHHATFDSEGASYDSLLVQVPGSLKAGAKSLLNVLLLGATTATLAAREARNPEPRPVASASPSSLAKARARLDGAARLYAADGKPVLSLVHISWASSNLTRDVQYFETMLGGVKTDSSSSGGVATYNGAMTRGDAAEFRYVQSSKPTQGPTSVADWEAYQLNLHKTCFKSKQNVGFDRLADNHIGHSEHGAKLDQFINAQKSSGLPYRIYNPPGKGAPPYFFYGYTPNGWGYQLTGTCSDASLCPKAPFYDMCTQGVLPDCTSA